MPNSILLRFKFNLKGFTLVEILIAIAVISIVAVVGIPNLRKFNQGQDFQKDTSELMRTLRRAQSNSQSSIVCPDNTASSSWSVSIGSNKTSFNLAAGCQNGATPTVTAVSFSPATQVHQIWADSAQCNVSAAATVIKFLNLDKSIQFSGDAGCISSTTNKVELYLQNQRNTSDIVGVVINKGGMVSQCEIDAATSRCK